MSPNRSVSCWIALNHPVTLQRSLNQEQCVSALTLDSIKKLQYFKPCRQFYFSGGKQIYLILVTFISWYLLSDPELTFNHSAAELTADLSWLLCHDSLSSSQKQFFLFCLLNSDETWSKSRFTLSVSSRTSAPVQLRSCSSERRWWWARGISVCLRACSAHSFVWGQWAMTTDRGDWAIANRLLPTGGIWAGQQ